MFVFDALYLELRKCIGKPVRFLCILHTTDEDKKIYVLGYADKARWKKALGGQYGCLYIDEINIADMDFVREASMR